MKDTIREQRETKSILGVSARCIEILGVYSEITQKVLEEQ